jgi:membrane protease YdiL (CAAX protease family)
MESPGASPATPGAGLSGDVLGPQGASGPTPGFVTVLVLALFLLLLTVGSALQQLAVYPGLVATELGLLLLPTWLVCRRRGWRPGQVLLLGPGRGPWAALSPLLGVLAFFMALGLTLPLLLLIVLAGGSYPGLPLPLSGTQDYLMAMAAGALAAPVCEELLFRGLVMRGLAPFGPHAAVWVSAALFGIFHMDPVRFVPTMALGVVYGYLAAGTGSVRPAMVAHGLNNGLALTLAWLGGGGRGSGAALDLESMRSEVSGTLPAAAGVSLELALLVAAGLLALLGIALAALVAWLLVRLAGPPGQRWAVLRTLPGAGLPLGRLARLPGLWGMGLAALVIWGLILWKVFAGAPGDGPERNAPEPEPSGIPGGEVTELLSVPLAPIPALWSASLFTMNTSVGRGTFMDSAGSRLAAGGGPLP